MLNYNEKRNYKRIYYDSLKKILINNENTEMITQENDLNNGSTKYSNIETTFKSLLSCRRLERYQNKHHKRKVLKVVIDLTSNKKQYAKRFTITEGYK